MTSLEELDRILRLEFGPSWSTFNVYEAGIGYNDAIVIDREDGQRIKADTLHRVFELLPEVLEEAMRMHADAKSLRRDLEHERCRIYDSHSDED